MKSVSRSHRRGFTLVELLVALILFAIVGAALVRLMTAVQRTTRTQSERTAMQGSLRTGLQAAIAMLQEITPNPDGTDPANATTDLLDITSATSLRFRAMRWYSTTCDAPINVAGTTTLKVRADDFTPVVLGKALVFDDGDDKTGDDDIWHEVNLTSVGITTCPDGGAAWALVGLIPGGITTWPAPVRGVDVLEVGLAAQGGRNWLGLRSLSAGEPALTPIAGPLVSDNPLTFEYLDENNTATAAPANVRSIVLTLRGESDRAADVGVGSTIQMLSDTVSVRIQLRNGR